jgi:hypothetical protein
MVEWLLFIGAFVVAFGGGGLLYWWLGRRLK